MGKTYQPTMDAIHISGGGSLTAGQYGEVCVSGSADIEGGSTLQTLRTSGSTGINGDCEIGYLHTSGSCTAKGNLRAKEGSISGSLHVGGHLWADQMKTSGSAHIKGALWGDSFRTSGGFSAEECDITGTLHVSGSANLQGNARANVIDCKGSFKAANVVADEVWLSTPNNGRYDEIYGKKVILSRYKGKSENVFVSLFGFSMSNSTAKPLFAHLIQGEHIELDYMEADVVRGKYVEVGPDCNIKRLEAQQVKIIGKPQIGEQVIGGVTLVPPVLEWKYPKPAGADMQSMERPPQPPPPPPKTEEKVDEEQPSQAFGKKERNLSVGGIGTLYEGTYDRVEVSGVGKIRGKVQASKVEISGTLSGEGELYADKIETNGSARIKGIVSGKRIECNGRLKVERLQCAEKLESNGSLYCEMNATLHDVECNGWLTVLGDLEAENFEAGPATGIKGMLNAESVIIDCSVYGGAREVVGESITIGLMPDRIKNQTVRIGSVTRAVMAARQAMRGYKMERFIAKSIEGTAVMLDHVIADVVRGHNVTIGKGCEIERLEYTGTLTQAEGAQVKQTVKL